MIIRIGKMIVKVLLHIIVVIITLFTLSFATIMAFFAQIIDSIEENSELNSLKEKVVTRLKVILTYISLIVDFIPMVLIASGYKIYDKKIISYCLSEDEEVKKMTDLLLIKNNLVVKAIMLIMIAADNEEPFMLSDLIEDFVDGLKKYDTFKKISKSYIEKTKDSGFYFRGVGTILGITVINLTIINTNYTWNH